MDSSDNSQMTSYRFKWII